MFTSEVEGWYERLFNQNVVVHAAFIGRSCPHIKLASKWWGHAVAWKEMIVNMSSLKKWERCVITARRIRENLTDYWGS